MQVIVNKSRAQWRASVMKVPLRIKDIEMIPPVSEEIKAMLRANPNIFLGKDAPYCYLSRLEVSFAELTIGCNLKAMVCFLSRFLLMFLSQYKLLIAFGF